MTPGVTLCLSVARGVSGPSLHQLVLVLQAVDDVGPRTFARGFEQFVVMLQRVLRGDCVVKMASGNGAPPVGDQLNVRRRASAGLQT